MNFLIINIFCVLSVLIYTAESNDEICQEKLTIESLEKAKSLFPKALPQGLAHGDVKKLMSREAETALDCANLCCKHEECNSITFTNNRCYILKCLSVKACKPKLTKKFSDDAVFIVLRDFSEEQEQNLDKLLDHTKKEKNVKTTTKVQKTTSRQTTRKPKYKPHVAPSSKPTKVFGLVADAGRDKSITIPYSSSVTSSLSSLSVVSIFGSCKHNRRIDDSALVYRWSRVLDSLASGKYLNNSQLTRTLLMVDLIPGKFTFQLTVYATGANGDKETITENSTAQMTLTVHQIHDTVSRNLMETVLKINVFHFTEQDKKNFVERLSHIIEKDMNYTGVRVTVQEISATYLNETKISFVASYKNKTANKLIIIRALELESMLKVKLLQHQFIMDYSIRSFQSKICYFDCNGHGTCDQLIHQCNCKFPWISNSYRERKTGIPNCSMHVILLTVGFVAALFLLLLICMAGKRIGRKCRGKNRYGKETLKYKLLDTNS